MATTSPRIEIKTVWPSIESSSLSNNEKYKVLPFNFEDYIHLFIYSLKGKYEIIAVVNTTRYRQSKS